MKPTKPSHPSGHPDAGQLAIGSTPATADAADPVIERPSGFYWQTRDGLREFGPFETRDLAIADRAAHLMRQLPSGDTP